MNGKRAKAIRRQVYGDKSLRGERKYVQVRNQRGKDGWLPGTIRNHPTSLRAQYQRAKRAT